MSSSVDSVQYSNNVSYNNNKQQLSASTRRKLEALGIDPTLVNSESYAQSLIKSRESQRSFEQYTVQNAENEKADSTQKSNSAESELISEAKSLAEQLGISVDNSMTFDEITSQISSAISDMFSKAQENPELLQQAQLYQAQLSQLTDNYNSTSQSTTDLYSAMSMQANHTKYMLGL